MVKFLGVVLVASCLRPRNNESFIGFIRLRNQVRVRASRDGFDLLQRDQLVVQIWLVGNQPSLFADLIVSIERK